MCVCVCMCVSIIFCVSREPFIHPRVCSVAFVAIWTHNTLSTNKHSIKAQMAVSGSGDRAAGFDLSWWLTYRQGRNETDYNSCAAL